VLGAAEVGALDGPAQAGTRRRREPAARRRARGEAARGDGHSRWRGAPARGAQAVAVAERVHAAVHSQPLARDVGHLPRTVARA